MDEILEQVLRNAVWERLDMLTELADAEEQDLVTVARSELPKLTEDWRELLAMHEPDTQGNCPECSSRWRQQRSPCPIWRAAYDHLVGGALSARPPKPSMSRRRAESTEIAAERQAAVGMRATAGAAY
ncbi:hypothetical protein [Sciscionella marina]|uniref:hypothetical protein n=1 Tax=Sciscionella marina TaxID=508770 RepID=UPI00037D335F|nr:hypothetical protein [Sciscionella marina]